MLFPSVGPEEVAGLRREKVVWAGGVLDLWSGRNAGIAQEPQRLVLCFHGNGSRADREFARMPRLWGRFPIEFFAVNYPGFGRSSGPASLVTLAAAALAAYDEVSLRASGRPVLLAGHSMGTVPALAVAARREVGGLVLHNPPPLKELINGRFGWWNLWLGAAPIARAVPKELDSIANARASAAPAVFLVAARDRLVPPRYQQKVIDNYGGPHRRVGLPENRHNTAVQEADLATVNPALDWLWSGGK